MNNELTLKEAALAWAQGKRVEAMHKTLLNRSWKRISAIGEEIRNSYSCGVFSDWGNEYLFRLAPEPPAKRYRPWTQEEVPVGAQVRYHGNRSSARMLIVSSEERGMLGLGSLVSYPELFDVFEHSTDNGKTWLPCGVQVEVES